MAMEAFLSILKDANPVQKADLLPFALEYEESGINFLVEILNDPELIVRSKAYELLQNIELQQAQQAVAPGLLFNPGDKIYQVNKKTIYFNDHNYILYADNNKNRIKKQLSTYDDYKNQGYKIVRFDKSAYVITDKAYYINYKEAEVNAESLHREILSQFNIESFDMNDINRPEKIKQWCSKYKVSYQEIINCQLEKDRQSGIVKWHQKNNINYNSNELKYIYWYSVEYYLKLIQNFDLLSQLWKDLIGHFTYIDEITFINKTYLSIDKYFVKINSRTNQIFSLGCNEREIDNILSSEKAETNFLIKALDHPQLEIRNTAYQLLKGIDLDKAKKAIHQGVKLNPGDRIYSVYRAGMWFTDEDYFLETWGIDYFSELRNQVYERYDVEEEEEGQGFSTRREFCFVEKEQAEQKAEFLHRETIKQTGIGIGGFEWKKENPNFDIKQWRIDNKISHECQYDWEIKMFLSKKFKDDTLFNEFRRAKYTYHPEHIDTWCKDNNLYYDKNLDNWDNYRKILNYLYLTENINLLSKFWKDGVGHFAFVCEEFVQKTTYVNIGKNLIDPVSKRNTVEIIARPDNYDELATNFLIDIINGTNIRAKFRAYQLLRHINTEKAEEALTKGIPISLGDQIYSKQELENPLKDDFNITAETSDAEFQQNYPNLNFKDIPPF